MALTKVTGQVIKNTTDVTVGVLTVTNTLAVGGTVSIGGTLTYEDVTNVDAVGLITARNGIVVGSGITLSKDGDGFFTGVTTATTFVGNLTGTASQVTIASGSDNRVLTAASANTIQGESNININGGILIAGHTVSTTVSNGEGPFIQVKSTDSRGGISLMRHSADAASGGVYIGKSRNATIGSNTIVQSGDELGRITFSGDDGTNVNSEGAAIKCHVDGTPGENDMPGRLQFYTTADGNALPTERLRIHSGGLVEALSSFSDTYSTTTSISPHFRVRNQNGTDNIYGGIQLRAERGNGAAAIFNIACLNSSTSYASTLVFQSRNTDGNFSEKLRIDSSGNVNIGSNTSANPFTYLRFGASQYGAADIRPTNEASHKVGLSFYVDGTQDTTINPTEALRIDSSGRVLIGQTSSVNGVYGSPPPRFSVSTTTASPAIFATYSNDVYGSRIDLIKSRSTTVGGTTVVQANDAIGEIVFGGADGDQFHPTALIQSTVESGVGNNDMPGDLRFFTNSGATTATERARIDSSGRVTTPYQPYCMLGKSSNQSIPNVSSTKITFDTEAVDRGGNFDTSNSRFTAPIAGDYLVALIVQYTQNVNQCHAGIWKNGGGLGTNFDSWVNWGDDTRAAVMTVVVNLAANDYIEGYTYQSTSGAMTLEANRTKMTIRFLG